MIRVRFCISWILISMTLPSRLDVVQGESSSDDSDSKLMINSTKAKLSQFPFMVALLLPHKREVHASGSLITKQHILTAAHLYWNIHFNALGTALAGDVQVLRKTPHSVKSRQLKKVVIAALHPKAHISLNRYQVTDIAHNVAILTVEAPFQLSDNLKPISLSYAKLSEYHPVISLGFGQTETEAPIIFNPLEKRALHWGIFTIDRNTCETIDQYPNIYCVHFSVRGVYYGDFGGPLLDRYKNPRQIGVLYGCEHGAATPWSAIYTNVQDNKNWITSHSSTVDLKSIASRLLCFYGRIFEKFKHFSSRNDKLISKLFEYYFRI